MRRDPRQTPVLSVRFLLVDGRALVRDWFMDDAIPEWTKTPPAWLERPSREWLHPQEPITLRGTVAAGHEDEARELVEAP